VSVKKQHFVVASKPAIARIGGRIPPARPGFAQQPAQWMAVFPRSQILSCMLMNDVIVRADSKE